MTREEALIILNGFKNNPLFNDTHAQALDMAISALTENKREFDGMTNKEAIETLFPSIELGEIHNGRHRFFLKGKAIETFDLKAHTEWLNAPYQKGGECE